MVGGRLFFFFRFKWISGPDRAGLFRKAIPPPANQSVAESDIRDQVEASDGLS